jgi:hypothetical protein
VQVVKMLRFNGTRVPQDYEVRFQLALWAFRHCRVYCPTAKVCWDVGGVNSSCALLSRMGLQHFGHVTLPLALWAFRHCRVYCPTAKVRWVAGSWDGGDVDQVPVLCLRAWVCSTLVTHLAAGTVGLQALRRLLPHRQGALGCR